jgi:hypothetical protein
MGKLQGNHSRAVVVGATSPMQRKLSWDTV